MKTNFSKERYLVLTETYTDKVIAIIKCEAGEQDITEKVYQAIQEDFMPESMVILGNDLISDHDYYRGFQVEMFCNDRTFEHDYTLSFAQVY